MIASCARVKRARPLLGTLVEINLEGERVSVLHRAASAAFDAVERVHHLMSFHSDTSDVTRLNRQAHRTPVAVTPATWKVLELADKVSRATDGAFDVSVGRRMMAHRALPRMTRVRLDQQATYRDIELLPGHQVFFRRALAVDLGGIAKGYAIDCAIEALRAHPGVAGTVNAGGDLRVFGPRAVPVQIRQPDRPSHIGAVATLQDAALATSACYAPSSGLPASGLMIHPRAAALPHRLRSASVRAATCAVADALAKAVFLMGENAAAVLKQFGASGFVLRKGGFTLIGNSA